MSDKIVSVIKKEGANYPDKKYLFRPHEQYDEYLFDEMSSEKNVVYELVRNSFLIREMDKEHIDTSEWNPLGELIKPGNYVVLKPNLVMDYNPSGDGVECLFTQPSVVAAVVDYVLIALKGEGTIVIGDAPMQECKLEKLLSESGYYDLLDYYQKKISEKKWNIQIELVDFRGFTSVVKHGVSIGKENEEHGKVVDLGKDSEFAIYDEEHINNLRITNYNPEILARHHTIDKHEYYISDEILKADVVINMPKPKTHRKAGVTIALKNLIGINVRKEYLPHHCIGEKASGGDEYTKKSILKKWKSTIQDKINYNQAVGRYKTAVFQLYMRKIVTLFIRVFCDSTWEGSWYGNETISKTIADLNKILMYSDIDGNIQPTEQRKQFIVADMVLSGEKDGPVNPSMKRVGIIAMGDQPVCFDEAIATLMGMDIRKIPTILQVRELHSKHKLVLNSDRAFIKSNVENWNDKYISQICCSDALNFVPSDGWKGHIELN